MFVHFAQPLACLGLLEHIMSSNCQTATALREALALGADSQVLIINTEGATDPENYRLQLTLPHVKPRDGMLTFELGACRPPEAKRMRTI